MTLKVAMLTYSTRPRGGVVHALSLAEALQRKGINVRLFSLIRRDQQDKTQGFFRPTTVPFEIYEFDWSDDIKERLRSMTEAFMERLPKDFEIYHAQDCVCDTALQLLISERRIKLPTVRTVHHVEDFPDQHLAKCEMMALRGDTVKITVSSFWQQELHKRYNINSTVIHNGIDLGKFTESGKTREPFILFIGGMEARKGLEYAIETIEMLTRRGRNIRLIAVARPGFRGIESRAWFDHLIERCGLQEKVELKELISEFELHDLYSRASVFLLPSRMEGWGLSIMEAMASGCPVVSTPVGGVTELISIGENGLLVEVGDISGFADAIGRLLDDKNIREMIVANARHTVRKYTWDSAADKTIQLYHNVIEQRRRSIL